MKSLFIIVSLLFLPACVASAESARTWASEFFAARDQIDQLAIDAVLAAHPEWDRKLAMYREVAGSQSAMFHYLFVYHAERGSAKLEWHDGDGTFGLFVCNCGQEGSVPTKEFEALFEKRSEAMRRFVEAFDEPTLIDVYHECGSAFRARAAEALKPLKERFDRLQKKPNQSLEPTTLLVMPRAYARVTPSRVVAHL